MSGIEMEQKGAPVEHKGDGTVGVSFASSEGLTLRSHRWVPQGPIKALVFYLHGYLDHVTMPGIVNLAESLKADGYAVFGMDDQGHGESDGLRGWVLLPKAHDDLLKFIGLVKKDFPNLPFYIIGHSMGGLLTTLLGITLTTKNPDPLFKGAVMLAAAYRYVDVPPPPAVKFLIWISQCCPTWQCICVPSPPDHKIFKDADNIRNHAKDPLKIDVAVRLGFGAAFMTAMTDADNHPERVTYPFLAITGDDDKIIDYRGSVNLHQKAATPEADKELLICKGAYHDLLHDTVKDQVVPAIKAWLNKRGGH